MNTDVQLAVVFADVVGSTQLYAQLGETVARELIAATLDLMRDATEQHRGSVVKTMGDEVMATFAHAGDAVAAAARMQRLIGIEQESRQGPARLSVRIGCHFGPVIREQDDVFGSTVHTASRLTSQAKAGQIMVTDAVVTRLSADWRDAVRHVDLTKLRGFRDEVAIYEVIWQTEDVTSVLNIRAILGNGKKRSARLQLEMADLEIALDDARTVVYLGRAEGNDLIVPGSLVSRLHARIEAGRASFQFIDQSTNGSFVQPEGEEAVFVRRDALTLTGEGRIGLGREPAEDDPGTVRYRCVD